MNTTETKIKEMEERLAVMKAFQEGKAIEFIHREYSAKGTWRDISNPVWDWNQFNYRMKKVPREVVCREEPNLGKGYSLAYPPERIDEILRNNPGVKLLKFREVLED